MNYNVLGKPRLDLYDHWLIGVVLLGWMSLSTDASSALQVGQCTRNLTRIVGTEVQLDCESNEKHPVEWEFRYNDETAYSYIVHGGSLVSKFRNQTKYEVRNHTDGHKQDIKVYSVTISNITLLDDGEYRCTEDVGDGPVKEVVCMTVIDSYDSEVANENSTAEEIRTPDAACTTYIVVMVVSILVAIFAFACCIFFCLSKQGKLDCLNQRGTSRSKRGEPEEETVPFLNIDVYESCPNEDDKKAILKEAQKLLNSLNSKLETKCTGNHLAATDARDAPDASAVQATQNDPGTLLKEFNILLIGKTGVGKSTFINAFYFYLYYANLEEAKNDNFHFPIPPHPYYKIAGGDQNELFIIGQSCTQSPKQYCLQFKNIIVRVIDTPGIADTRQIKQDKDNILKIFNHIASINHIHCICIVLNSKNNLRKNTEFKYYMEELLSNIHRNALPNLAICYTHSEESRSGDAVTVLQDFFPKDTLTKDAVYHMDNKVVKYLEDEKKGKQALDAQIVSYWSIAVDEITRLITTFWEKPPHLVDETLGIHNARRMVVGLAKVGNTCHAHVFPYKSVRDDEVSEIYHSKQQFASYLKSYAITSYNTAYREYYNYYENKNKELGKSSTASTDDLVKDYTEEAKTLLDAKDDDAINELYIRGQMRRLHNLEVMGKSITSSIPLLQKIPPTSPELSPELVLRIDLRERGNLAKNALQLLLHT